MKRIVLLDTERTTREMVRQRVQADSHQVLECETGAQTLERVREGAHVVVIGRPPQGSNTGRLLQQLLGTNPELPVIVACSSPDETLDALNEGAFYVTRPPIHPEEVAILVRRALAEQEPVRRRSSPPEGELRRPVLLGQTPEIRAIREAVGRLVQHPTTTVLLLGESGTGKGTIARLIHSETNQGGLFVDLSGWASSESSSEAELFGTQTAPNPVQSGLLERANRGTLFLGEIADIPLSIQASILRFVQDRTFHRAGEQLELSQARVIATSNRSLDLAMRDGAIQAELMHHLAVVTLEIPPLRERRADIPLLVEHFLGAIASKGGTSVRGVTEAALKRLVDHSWPGNVRELVNVLESAALITDAEQLDLQHLPPLSRPRSAVDYRLPAEGINFRELEREVLLQALRLASGNQTRAASLLGLTRDQIRYRMAKFGMTGRDTAACAA